MLQHSPMETPAWSSFIIGLLVLIGSPSLWASPFSEACQPPIVLNETANKSWLNFSYATEDSQKLQASHLLTSVLNLAQEKLGRDLTFSAKMQACLEESQPSEECAEMREAADVHIPRLVQDARMQLILGQSPMDPMATFGKADTQPNLRMRAYGHAKLKNWDPATPQEKKAAADALKSYRAEIITHYLKTWNQQKYTGSYGERKMVNESLRVTREDHFRQYRSFFVALPFLHYLHSPKPDRQEVLNAFREFDVNANSELIYLDELVAGLEAEDVSRYSDAVAASLQYSAYLEFQLLNNPDYCGLATSLLNTYTKRTLGWAVSLGLPLLVGSIFAPEIVAYPLGIVASSYFAIMAYNDYELARIRAVSVMMLDPGSNPNADLVQAQNNLGVQLILFPLSFTGGRVFSASLKSFATGSAVTNKALNSAVYLPKRLLEITNKYSSQRLAPVIRD